MASSILSCAVIVGLLIGTRGQQLLIDDNISSIVAEHHHHTCPPWTRPNGTACLCNTQEDSNVLKCDAKDPNTMLLLDCYCFSNNYSSLNTAVYGKCIYSCSQKQYHKIRYASNTITSQGCDEYGRK